MDPGAKNTHAGAKKYTKKTHLVYRKKADMEPVDIDIGVELLRLIPETHRQRDSLRELVGAEDFLAATSKKEEIMVWLVK